MNDACVKKDRRNKSPPLIWRITKATHTTKLLKTTSISIGRSRVGAGKLERRHVGNSLNSMHARCESGAHVDQKIARGSNHGIERRLSLHRRAGENSHLDELCNKYRYLDDRKNPYNPRLFHPYLYLAF